MAPLPPPHPGVPPTPVVFPFAEAAEARRAITQLADRLRDLRRVHEDARDRLEGGGAFEGATADAFRKGFDVLMDGLDRRVQALEAELELLDTEVRRAHARQQAYEAALMQWRVAERAWADWRAPEPVVAGR